MLAIKKAPEGEDKMNHDVSKQGQQPIAVTTARRRKDKLRPRAHAIAERLGAPFLERHGLGPLSDSHGFDWFYVVGHQREEVVSKEGKALFVQPGMYRSKLVAGLSHPLMQACAPTQNARTLLDCTLGLAHDALHLAGVLSLRVLGAEKSPVLQCLLEEGLARLGAQDAPWAEAAKRVTLHKGDAYTLLEQLKPNSFDVVYLDPMMPYHLKATPAFEQMRAANLGAMDQPDATILRRAAEVAQERVVLKQPKNAPPPPMRVDRIVFGAHVQYAICESHGL
jgi:CheY-like chemotaxis protein